MTGLVLSGGGLWAAAQIGVLRALEEMGIEADFVVGTSAGAVVGALYACGLAPDAIGELACQIDPHLFRVPWPRLLWNALRSRRLPTHVITVDHLFSPVEPWLRNRSFGSAVRPLLITATDLVHRQVVAWGPPSIRFDEGLGARTGTILFAQEVDLWTAVRASTAFPGLFAPVRLADRILVDGGVGDDFPVDVAILAGADRVIGVWIDEPLTWHPPRRDIHAASLLYQSLAVMIRQLSTVRPALVPPRPQVIIRIPMDAARRAVSEIPRLIDTGYRCALERRTALQALVA